MISVCSDWGNGFVRMWFLTLFTLSTAVTSSWATDELTLHGPQRYERHKGTPTVYTETFKRCEPSGLAYLRIWNGDSKDSRITAARIAVNGELVVKDEEFKQWRPYFEVPVNVATVNELEITLKSGDYKVPAFLDIEVIGRECDVTPPVISNPRPANGALLNTARPEIAIDYSDSEAGASGIDTDSVRLLVDGQNVTGAASVTASGVSYTPLHDLPEGDHAVYVTVADGAVNLSEFRWDFTTDTVSPVITVDSHGDGVWLNTPDITLAGSWSDERGETPVITLNGAAPTVSIGHYSLPVSLGEGANSFNVVATDTAGNSAEVFFTINLDTIAPSVVIDTPSTGSLTNRTTIDIVGHADETLISAEINSSSAVLDINNTFSANDFPLVSEGNNLLTATVTDRAGNKGSVSVSVTRDTVAPTVNILSPAADSLIDEPNPQIVSTYSDATSGIDLTKILLKLDGIVVTPLATVLATSLYYIPVDPLEESEHTAFIFVADAAGNSVEQSVTFTIESRCKQVDPVPSGNDIKPFMFSEPAFDGESYPETSSYDRGRLIKAEIADVNRDGYPDIVAVDKSSGNWSRFKNRLTVLLGREGGGFEKSFDFAESYSSSSILALAQGDFNGDCYPDIAVFRADSNALTVYLNQGDGTFSQSSSFSVAGKVNTLSSLLTGDFDKDGFDDILVANQGAVTFEMFNGRGDGSFAPATVIEIATQFDTVVAVTAVSHDDDSGSDIVVILGEDYRHGEEVARLSFSSSGPFDQETIHLEEARNLVNLVNGDFNGDESVDVAAVAVQNISDQLEPSNFSIMMFVGNGHGGFSAGSSQKVWIENNHSAKNNSPSFKFIEAVDVDGDHVDEIVVSSDGSLFVYAANTGVFDYSRSYFLDESIWIEAADFDRDGDEDIVSLGWGRDGYVAVLINGGDGAYIDRTNVSLENWDGHDIVAADIDGDRRLDLAMPGDNYGSGVFSTLLNRDDGWGQAVHRTLNQKNYVIGGNPTAVKTGDFNGDGLPDTVTSNGSYGNVAVFINQRNGVLKSPIFYSVGQEPADVEICDFNSDNIQDIVTINKASGSVSVLLGKGDGTFHNQLISTASLSPNYMSIGDFNRDGKPDIAVTDNAWGSKTVSVLIGKGDGTFQSVQAHIQNYDGRLETIRNGDINSDGFLDLIVRTSGAIALLAGRGDGSFVTLTTVADMGSGFQVADFNRDGFLDMVGSKGVYLGDGAGNFQQSQSALPSAAKWGIRDINRDGNIDIVSSGGDFLNIWIGQGDGTFMSRPSIVGINFYDFTLTDMNADGIVDIVMLEDAQKLTIISGQVGGMFSGTTAVNKKERYAGKSLATADFNGDGNQDIAVSLYRQDWHNKPKGPFKIEVYSGSGFNTFTLTEVIEPEYNPSYWDYIRKIFADDFDGDGHVDIALHVDINYQNKVYVFLNRGDGSFQEGLIYEIEDNRKLIDILDVTGDGLPDIVNDVEVYSSLKTPAYGVSVHAGNGDGTFQFHSMLSLEDYYQWHMNTRFGDFNNDGQQDLAVQFSHYAYDYNDLKVYLGDGGVFSDTPVYEAQVGDYDFLSLVGDFNNDNFDDIVLDEQLHGRISLFSSKGDGTFDVPEHYATGTSGGRFIAQDFNLDGRLDIAVSDEYHGLNLLYNLLPPLKTPPAAPLKLQSVAEDRRVTLNWAENTETDLDGYNVYRSQSIGGDYEKINTSLVFTSAYTDTSVTNGKDYFYTVAAVDSDGEESSLSVKIQVVPHAPDTTPPVITVVAPFHNQTVSNSSLFVKGTVDDPDAQITVNGIAATIQKSIGTFTAYNVPLNVGVNQIQIVAKDRYGNMSSRSLAVNYAPTATIEGNLRDDNMVVNLKNIRVDIQDAVKTQTAYSDSDGKFTVMNVFPGDVTIEIRSNYHPLVVINRTVEPGENVTLDVALPPYPATVRVWLYDATTYSYLRDATVTVTDPSKTQTVAAVNGYFQLNDVTPFKMTLSVDSPGYAPFAATRSITNRWTNYFYFYLNPVPPVAPVGITSESGSGYVKISWQANAESNLDYYEIYRSTTPGSGYQAIGSASYGEPSFTDGSVTPDTTYYYVVAAVNTSAQQSDYSPEIADSAMPMAVPTGLSAEPGKERVSLSWDLSNDSTVTDYRLYRSTELGSGYTLIKSVNRWTTSYVDTQVEAGVSYYYVVTAVNQWGGESGWSNEATAVPEAVTVAVQILSPSDRSYSPVTSILVRGAIESVVSEVGVVLIVESSGKGGTVSARYVSEVNGNEFGGEVELFPGVWNTLRAVATLPDGEQAEAVIGIVAGADEAAASLSALPPSGILSAQTGTYEVTFAAEVNVAGTILSYGWDFDGDGSIDKTTLEAQTSTAYTRSGLFMPAVTVTVTTGEVGGEGEPVTMSLSASTLVNVLSRDAMDAILRAKWEGMKRALAAGDVERAVGYFDANFRNSFRQQFNLLAKDLTQIVNEMGTTTLVNVRGKRAIYDLRTVRDGSVYSFQLEFVRDENGLWRIRSF